MFLDPIQYKQAQDYLAQGAVLEAARVLLAAPEPRHRRVQQLLLNVQAALLKKGEELFQQGGVSEAWTYLEAANRCASLPAEARGLFDNVAAAYRGLVYRQQRKKEQWQEAQRQAAAGHLHTAAELVQGLSLPEAQGFEEDLRRECQRLVRYVTQARDYLDRGQYQAARECYRRARQISPQDPEVVALAAELAARLPPGGQTASPSPKAPPMPIRDRHTAWRLDTLGAVLSAEEISIGRAGGPARLPLWGKLHRRHALLMRNDQRWQILPCRDAKGQLCPVRVDGSALDAPTLLHHGQRIEFGSGNPWRFCQPLSQSGTALLEGEPPDPCGTPLLGNADHKRLILLADELRIAAHGPAHLLIETLPCRLMRLVWQPEGLVCEVEGGRGATELPNGVAIEESPPQVYLPSRIVLEGELEESEWLGRVMLQHQPAEEMRLAILPA